MVFGSYVRGEQRDDMDLIAYTGLQLELSDALGLHVDLVEREVLRPPSIPSAVRTGLVVKRDPAACFADMLDYARDAQSFVVGMSAEMFETVTTFVPLLICRLPDMIDEISP